VNGYDPFPLACGYPAFRGGEAGEVLARERGVPRPRFDHTERHVQAVWFDPHWRPSGLVTRAGEPVVVDHPGRWNLEAGPDFLGATLGIGRDRRVVQGDVEVHIAPAGWRQHGHRDDPRYRHVVLHLTYFEGGLPEGELPPGAVEVALRPLLARDPAFAFEQIDVTQYPYAGRADLPPCRLALRGWSPERRRALLAAAGHERLRRKSERWATALADRGLAQALYEGVLAVLGYHHNQPAMRTLAARLPLDRLLDGATGDEGLLYARLAGCAGWLPERFDEGWDEETAAWVRAVWDIWWKERDRLPGPLPAAVWHRQGLRPLNHPRRRLAAAVAWLINVPEATPLLTDWIEAPEGQGLAVLRRCFQPVPGGYWSRREHLGGARSSSPVALVGDDRLRLLAINVLLPMAAACGAPVDHIARRMAELKPEPISQPMKEAAFYLFGPDHPSSLYRDGVARQGLLQIFSDYCLVDRTRCSGCALPGWIQQQG
jgi:hypothetical protein